MDETFDQIAVERSIDLSADPETVWAHLTDGDLLSSWMGSQITIEPRVGGAIGMAGPNSADVFGVVEEIVPNRRLQWSWRTHDGMPALVEIELEACEGGTRLTVSETLLPWQVTELPTTRYLPGRSPLQPGMSLSSTAA